MAAVSEVVLQPRWSLSTGWWLSPSIWELALGRTSLSRGVGSWLVPGWHGDAEKALCLSWEQELTLGKRRESSRLGPALRVTPAHAFGHQSPHQPDSGRLWQLDTAPCPDPLSLYPPSATWGGGHRRGGPLRPYRRRGKVASRCISFHRRLGSTSCTVDSAGQCSSGSVG